MPAEKRGAEIQIPVPRFIFAVKKGIFMHGGEILKQETRKGK